MAYSEIEKVILRKRIGDMLETGQDYAIIDTAEIIGDIMGPDGHKIVHKAFCVQINMVIEVD